jgi:hypothetical protein
MNEINNSLDSTRQVQSATHSLPDDEISPRDQSSSQVKMFCMSR